MTWQKQLDQELSLRLLEESDSERCFDAVDANRAYLRRWLNWVDGSRTPEDTLRWIKVIQREWREGKSLTLGIWSAEKMVGCIDLQKIDLERGSAEIGYWLAAERQGNGIITHACCLLINDCFRERGFKQLSILVHPDNLRSVAIPKRLGFRLEERLVRASLLHDEWIDLDRYSLSAESWKMQQSNELTV